MKAIEQLERLKMVYDTIKAKKTGTPKEFARHINMSRRRLYEYIDIIKDHGVEVSYSKSRKTFFLNGDKELNIFYGIELLSKDEIKNIDGGTSVSFDLCFFYAQNNNSFESEYLL